MDTLRIETAQHVDITYDAAGVGDRVIATITDYLIQMAILALAVIVIWSIPGPVPGYVFWVALILITLYHPLCEIFFNGQSPGKRAVGTRVARVDGGRPGIGGYILRWLLGLVEIWATVGVVALVAVTANRRGQRIGDMAAGTAVIRVRKESTPGAPASGIPEAVEHEPVFPEAAVLAAEDVQIIRAVVNQVRANGRNARTERLAKRTKEIIEGKLGLTPVDLPAYRFLIQVLADHQVAAAPPPPPASTSRWQPAAPRPASPAPTGPDGSRPPHSAASETGF